MSKSWLYHQVELLIMCKMADIMHKYMTQHEAQLSQKHWAMLSAVINILTHNSHQTLITVML